jgi:NAD(P)H-hydrate epimerase
MDRLRGIPAVTADQMAAVDSAMFEVCGLDVLQVMETAGRAVALFSRDHHFHGDARGMRILILCGSGGNGGDGMVAARYLHGWGANPEVWLATQPDPGRGITAHQLAVVERLGLPVSGPEAQVELPAADLVIDALLGFGIRSAPAGRTATLIDAANNHGAPALAVDLPSGLDATTGKVFEPCIRARTTLTLALPKTGLLSPEASRVCGDVVVADIGVPRRAYEAAGLSPPDLFSTREFVEAEI